MEGRVRVGIGYDVHPFAEGRRLVLGGVVVPFGRGLTGWSDADVLTHAIIDAMLGAASLGDIGSHFPPGDMKYKDISSLVLLERVRDELARNGWQVGNIDVTIVAEQPMLGSFIGEMRLKLSNTLGIDVARLSIKASSSAGLGFVGNGEGIEAQAVALIEAI
ncbi:MAG: 2-C-methyl-D-erythritol 2,4-cyclodiphosphate synthase [Dehalococcoidales bacterium]|nr:2-C-methyl-D-erythritol 2,4-cyclodiphosphate synthase [Dehalococcoidales bacterium]